MLTDTAAIVRRAGSGVAVPAGVVARFLAATEPLLPACSAASLAGLADALTVFSWIGLIQLLDVTTLRAQDVLFSMEV